jgi:hypothetical protein
MPLDVCVLAKRSGDVVIAIPLEGYGLGVMTFRAEAQPDMFDNLPPALATEQVLLELWTPAKLFLLSNNYYLAEASKEAFAQALRAFTVCSNKNLTVGIAIRGTVPIKSLAVDAGKLKEVTSRTVEDVEDS